MTYQSEYELEEQLILQLVNQGSILKIFNLYELLQNFL